MRTAMRLAVALGLIVPSWVAAAPPRVPPTVLMYSTVYLGDAGLQAELKLKPEQITKLKPLLIDFHLDIRNSETDRKRRDELSAKQEAKLSELLDAGQRHRLRQVVLQHLGRIRFGGPVLAEDEELSGTLKLTDEQKKQLREETPLDRVLTDEQKKRWQEAVGVPYPARLHMSGIDGVAYVMMPEEYLLLLSEPVEYEMKLTDKQQEEVYELAGRWHDAFPAKNWDEVKAMTPEMVKPLRAVLTPAQAKRLDQLLLRQAVARHGPASQLPLMLAGQSPELAGALKLTEEQKAKLNKLRSERTRGLYAIYTSGDDLPAIKEKAAKYQAETPALLEAELTADQKKQLPELLGEPMPPGYSPFMRYPYPRVEKSPLPRTFLAAVSLTFASSPVLHKALGLDEEQVKKVLALQKETKVGPAEPGEEAERKRREQAETIELALGKILKPVQWQRWKQLVLRQYSIGGFTAPDDLQRLVEFQEGLSLSPVQLRRLLRGTALVYVLDDKQQARWKEMLGEPLAPTKPGPVVIFANPNGLAVFQLRCVVDPGVQAELKLTDDQKKQLIAEAAKARTTFPAREGPTEEWHPKAEKRAREVLATVAKILDETQSSRLRQIALWQQVNWTRGLLPLFTLDEVAAGLKLTAKQSEAIPRLGDEHAELSQMISRVPPIERDASYPVLVELSKVIDGKVRAALTEEQRGKLKEMLGEEYKGGYPRPSRDSFLPFP